MVASVDFDFHYSFLIILALFAASVLAIFYLSLPLCFGYAGV
jgi:hypothetical protein